MEPEKEKVTNSKIILAEAKKLGIKVKRVEFGDTFFIMKKGNKRIVSDRLFFCTGGESFVRSSKIGENKLLTCYLWNKAGIPIPRTYFFNKLKELRKNINKIKFPVIIKEVRGSLSVNAYPDISSKKELLSIAKKLDKKGFIVQQMIQGNEYRVLVYKGKVVACLRNIHPFVIGDGQHDINYLIDVKNKSISNKIKKNKKVKDTLKKDGRDMKSVPKDGQKVFLRHNACMAEGGESQNCTDVMNKKIAKMCIKATDEIGLGLGGIDIFCDDIAKDPKEQEIWFIEINSRPDITIHHYPTKGKPINVAKIILSDAFKS